jgi:hypothetical protein
MTDISLQGVDLLAGVEAIISHLIVKEFKIPAAHAPAVLPPPLSPLVSPRSAAEEVYMSFCTRAVTITELSNYQFTSGMVTIILPLQRNISDYCNGFHFWFQGFQQLFCLFGHIQI